MKLEQIAKAAPQATTCRYRLTKSSIAMILTFGIADGSLGQFHASVIRGTGINRKGRWMGLIEIEADQSPETIQDLHEWLGREELEGVNIAFAPGKQVAGTLGAELPTGLLLLLKGHLVAPLARAIGTWFKVRKPKIKLTIKSGKKQFTLEAENTEIDKELVDNLMALLREAS